VLADPNADAVLAINCPTAVADSTEAARAVIKAAAGRNPRANLLTAWLGAAAPAEARALFAAGGIPTHETPDEAVRAFMYLADHARHQRLLRQVPSGAAGRTPDRAGAASVIDRAIAEGREMLSDPEAKAVLAAYGVPVLATETAASPAEAAEVAKRLGGLVALKILSPDISHKSDVGGVALDLAPGAVEAAAQAMLERVKRLAPQARLKGFMVQAMADKPRAHELIAGLAVDPTFGPVVLFGAGGTAVEVLADRVVGLPPLNEPLAMDMIGRTRMARLLAGYRDRPPADQSAVADVLVRLSALAADLPAIAELDINPLLADENGVLALDSRIRIAARPPVRPAICPYPARLSRPLEIAGEALEVRAIRPDDAPRLVDLVARSDAEDVRLRFRTGLKRLPEVWAARLSQIDYDREMALVAVDAADAIVGVARLAGDPQGETAEFALMVRSDRQRQGLGHALMAALIDYARGRRYQRLWGSIARENEQMLCLAGDLGFALETDEADVSLTRATLALT
jgi:acetyltransferase